MPPPYSAGSIFLQIVPSFKGGQQEIAREARALGEQVGKDIDAGMESQVGKSLPKAIEKAGKAGSKEAEKAGDDAGKKYAGHFATELKRAISATQRELKALKIPVDDTEARQRVAGLKGELGALAKAKIGVNLDADTALETIRGVAASMKKLQADSANLDVRVNAAKAFTTIEKVAAGLQALNDIEVDVTVKEPRSQGKFEQSLRNAAKRALTDLPSVEIDADATGAKREIDEIRKELAKIADADPEIELDAGDAFLRLGQLQARLELLSRSGYDIGVSVDAAGAAAQLAGLLAMVEKLNERDRVKIDVDIDGKAVDKQIGALNKLDKATERAARNADDGANSFRAFNGRLLTAAAGGAALVPILTAISGGLGAMLPLMAVGAVAAGVLGLGLSGIKDAVSAMGDAQKNGAKDLTEYNRAVTGAARDVARAQEDLQRAQEDAGTSAEDSNRRVMDALQNVADAEQKLVDARTDAARGAQQAARRVEDAVQAQEEAVRGLTEAQEEAARANVDAQRRVEDAVRGVDEAERSYNDAQRTSLRAQEDLTRARRDAIEAQEDLVIALRESRDEEAQTALDLDEARDVLARAIANGFDADVIAQRSLDVQKLETRLAKAQERTGDLTEEDAEWARTGVEGSEKVISARERVEDAQRGVEDAVRGVADAQRDETDARNELQRTALDGIRRVADAQERMADATQAVVDARTDQADQERDSARAILDAQQNILDAQRDVTDARREQGRAAVDSQRAIEDAQDRVVDTQLAYTKAINDSSTAQDNLAKSMAALGPAGQDFARFLFDLKPLLNEFRSTAQEGLLPGLQSWIQSIVDNYGPQFLRITALMSGAIGDMFASFGDSLDTPAFRGLFDMIEAKGPLFIDMMGQVLSNLGEGVASLTTALEPLGELFGGWLVDGTKRFTDWAESIKGSDGLGDFFALIERVGPKVGDFLFALASALIAIATAIEPFGEDLLVGFTAFLNWIANMDTAKLQAIVVGIAALVVAFQALVGLNALVTGAATVATIWGIATGGAGAGAAAGATGLAAWTGAAAPAAAATTGLGLSLGALVLAIGLIIIIAGLLAVAFYLAWHNSETFRDIVTGTWQAISTAAGVAADWFMDHVWPIFQQVWGFISDVAQGVWDDVLRPIFDLIGQVFGDTMELLSYWWTVVGKPVFDFVAEVVSDVWINVLKPIFELIGLAFGALWGFVSAYWNGIGKPIFDAIIEIISFLWIFIVSPYLRLMADLFGFLFGVIASAYNTVARPVLEAFGGIVSGLVQIFQGSFDGIKTIWNALVGLFLAPVKFVVETVINGGIIGGINWIAEKFGQGPKWIQDVPTDWIGAAQDYISFSNAPGRATGGTIPGSSPHKKADNIPIWATAGEFMQPVDSVDYYGMDIMEAMRKRQIPREFFQMRAEGGEIYQQMFARVKKVFPRANLNSGWRPGASDYHGQKKATDLGEMGFAGGAGRGYLAAMKRWIYETYPNSTELIYDGLGSSVADLKNGKAHNYGRALQEQHRNHVHWAMETMAMLMDPKLGAPTTVTDGVGSDFMGLTGIFGAMKDFITDPSGFLKGIVTKWAGNGLDNPLGKMLINIPFKIAEWAVDPLLAVVGKVANVINNLGETTSTVDDANAGNKQIVQRFAAQRGWDTGAQWNALDALIMSESGYRNTAQNPNSTAYGMFQFLNSTWAGTGFAKTANPGIQAQAGLRYIDQRYGDPIKAWAFHRAHGSYGEGGPIAPDGTELVPELHDTGGVIHPGWNLILNATRRPEASLNPEQLSNIESIANRGAGGPGTLIEVYPQPDHSPLEIAQMVSREQEWANR